MQLWKRFAILAMRVASRVCSCDAEAKEFMISLTPTASTKVKEIMGMQNPVPVALRVAARVGGGCSGASAVDHMAFENQTNETDQVVDFNGL